MPDETWLDADAGPLVRPYAVTRGRTRPGRTDIYMITMVLAMSPDVPAQLGPEHTEILRVAQNPVSVAEVSALLGLPLGVVKVLVSDLVDRRHLIASSPYPTTEGGTDVAFLNTLLDAVSAL